MITAELANKILDWNGQSYDLDWLTSDQLEDLFSEIVDAGHDATDRAFKADCTQAWQTVSNELSDRRSQVLEQSNEQLFNETIKAFEPMPSSSGEGGNDGTVWTLVGWDGEPTCFFPGCQEPPIKGDVLCPAHVLRANYQYDYVRLDISKVFVDDDVDDVEAA